MKYPQLVNTLQYKRIDNTTYLVRNYATNCNYTLDDDSCRFIQNLDGKTNPYSIRSNLSSYEIEHLLKWLNKNELTRRSRMRKNGLLSVTITLFTIKATTNMKVVSWFLNVGLILCFLPLLITGLLFAHNNYSTIVNHFSYPLLIIGLILGQGVGIVLHESAHAISGLAFRAKVSECGLLIGLFMFGAYVEIYEDNIKSRLKKIEIYAAGIEMNLSLVGISLVFTNVCDSASSLFYGIAISNMLLGLINLLPIVGLDGGQITSLLLGDEYLSSVIDLLFDSRTRKQAFHQGINGYVKIVACIIGLVSQIAYPVLLIVNICSIWRLFE